MERAEFFGYGTRFDHKEKREMKDDNPRRDLDALKTLIAAQNNFARVTAALWAVEEDAAAESVSTVFAAINAGIQTALLRLTHYYSR
jgi:hypothetical protein